MRDIELIVSSYFSFGFTKNEMLSLLENQYYIIIRYLKKITGNWTSAEDS